MIWLRSLNLYAMAALVILGGVIVTGIFRAGVKYEQRKDEAEMAKINAPLAEQRGKDEAELSASDAEAAKIDAAVRAALKARFILDEDTARLLNSVGGK